VDSHASSWIKVVRCRTASSNSVVSFSRIFKVIFLFGEVLELYPVGVCVAKAQGLGFPDWIFFKYARRER